MEELLEMQRQYDAMLDELREHPDREGDVVRRLSDLADRMAVVFDREYEITTGGLVRRPFVVGADGTA